MMMHPFVHSYFYYTTLKTAHYLVIASRGTAALLFLSAAPERPEHHPIRQDDEPNHEKAAENALVIEQENQREGCRNPSKHPGMAHEPFARCPKFWPQESNGR